MDVTEAADWRKAVYAVTFGDDIFRIGSSLGRLVLRVGSVTLWQRHSTGRYVALNPCKTPNRILTCDV